MAELIETWCALNLLADLATFILGIFALVMAETGQ